MDLKECYTSIGADYEEVVRRFTREGRVDHFLELFLWDQSFAKLCGAMDAGDTEDALQQAYMVKGISMSLGLAELTTASSGLTEDLRLGKMDDHTLQCFEKVRTTYLRTVEAVKEHLS